MEHPEDFRELVQELNRVQLPAFLEKPVSERILFVAHCIQKPKRAEIKKYAESLGYRVYIVGGESIVKKRILKEKPSAVVGIACYDELKMAAEFLKIPYQIVLLDTDGCEDTDFNIETAKELLSRTEPVPGLQDSAPAT